MIASLIDCHGAGTAAAAKANEPDALEQFLGSRLHRYAHTANAVTYMRGWSNRILLLQQFLLQELKGA